MGSLAGTLTAEPATSAEDVLAEMLAGVMKIEQVPIDSHFFDDLGADSLVMAKFCARVRKREGLPVMSMKDIYANPTIRSLAEAFGIAEAEAEVDLDAIATLIQPRDPILARSAAPAPASTRQYLTCGALQLLSFLGYAWVIALVGARAYEWISAAHGYAQIYLRSVVFGGAGFIVLCTLPILAKWVLIGRWKPQQIRIWSLGYFRFWVVKTLVRSNPLAMLTVGSPLYTWYLRALGAKIGRGTVIFTRHVPVCTDLLTIGPDTVIRKESFFNCYRAYAGWIQTGRVTIGRNVFIGEKTVLDINTSMGDVSQLGHASVVAQRPAGPDRRALARVPGPAHRPELPAGLGEALLPTFRRIRFSAVTLFCLFFLYPAADRGRSRSLLLTAVPSARHGAESRARTRSPRPRCTSTRCSSRWCCSSARCSSACSSWRPCPACSACSSSRARSTRCSGSTTGSAGSIARMTGVKFFTRLFGDSSYITSYLRWLGYDQGQVVQTGSNFGTDVGQENPYMCIIGSGTMVADGLRIMNSDVSATSFRVSPVYIGGDSFFGNNIYYPAGGRVGNNCLIATKAMIPLDGKVREGVGLLGSPSFEIPRTVERDQAVELDEDEQRRRLRAKNWHNLRTIGIFLFVRWLHVFLVTAFALAAFDSYGGFAQLEMGLLFAVSFLITPVYFVLVERLIRGFRRLQPQYCSIYDPYFWRHERLWKVPAELYVRMFDGTPFKNVVWRGLGAKVGKRVFDDGCHFTERSLTIVGDDVTLNVGSEIQCHSQEDGAFKSDRTTIGNGCTIGVGAMVHYGVTMGERSVLAPDSFLMKGEEIPPHARWGGNPAREM